MSTLPFSLMGSEFEIASIYADVVLKRIKDKKLMIFRAEPERLEFLYKMFLPLFSKDIGGMSILLAGRFFERSFNTIYIDRASLDSKLKELVNGLENIEYSDLDDLKNIFFDNIPNDGDATPRDVSSRDFPQISKKIIGAYPNDFYQTLKTEFSLLKNIPQVLDTSGTILYVTLTQEGFYTECNKVVSLLKNLDEDAIFLDEASSKVFNIVKDSLLYLEAEKVRLENQYKSRYKSEEEMSKEKLDALEKESFQKERKVQSEFKDEIQEDIISDELAMKYIRDVIIVRPTSNLDDLADDIRRIRSIMETQMARSMALDTRLKLEDTCSFYESKIAEMSSFTKDEAEKINEHLKNVEKDWQDEAKKMEDRINDIDKIGKEIKDIIDRLSVAKQREKDDVISNATYEYSFDGTLLIPFYVASLCSSDGERRFEVYAPSQYDKGFMILNKIQGFSMPLRPISKGLQDLRICIMRNLEQDERLQKEVLNAGRNNNLLTKIKYVQNIREGLIQLKRQNLIKEGSHQRAMELLDQYTDNIY